MELKSSDEYSELKALTEELTKVKDQRAAVRGEVFRKISPLGRVLRKYRKLLEGTPEGTKIDSYLKDPSGTFVKGVPLTPILEDLQKALAGGHISLKDKEMGKMQKRLKDAMSTDFDALDKKYRDAAKEAESIRQKVKENKIGRKISDLEVSIGEKEARIGKMEDEIGSMEKDVPNIHEKIEDKRKDLEGLLEDIMGGEVNLTL
jgi:predicted  nucleic acid-binding Zn-ribbon protein